MLSWYGCVVTCIGDPKCRNKSCKFFIMMGFWGVFLWEGCGGVEVVFGLCWVFFAVKSRLKQLGAAPPA